MPTLRTRTSSFDDTWAASPASSSLNNARNNSFRAPKHVLIRARNSNVSQHRHQKKSNTRRQVQDDPDYALPQSRSLQPATKQNTKLEAVERRMHERKAELEDDPLLDASRMCPDRVWCIPCDKYIQIDSRRPFYATLWHKHRGKCHRDVPFKRSELSKQMESKQSPVDLDVPLIDDAFASSILAEMYSKAQSLHSLAAVAHDQPTVSK
ncbi:hypothetical protein BT96DRAFT_913921 [Gymnopus androsaceus JB14]|uniref:Uncharacterized protein n=1 Tax=Gymnopus androsaceus JB14 TaxID=1447944 RepID=A0A6A4ICE3_9AGAR|nr:hypothetical protein BT96DRAFT_913921 [Gymnopus androsaceus JB14]